METKEYRNRYYSLAEKWYSESFVLFEKIDPLVILLVKKYHELGYDSNIIKASADEYMLFGVDATEGGAVELQGLANSIKSKVVSEFMTSDPSADKNAAVYQIEKSEFESNAKRIKKMTGKSEDAFGMSEFGFRWENDRWCLKGQEAIFHVDVYGKTGVKYWFDMTVGDSRARFVSPHSVIGLGQQSTITNMRLTCLGVERAVSMSRPIIRDFISHLLARD